MSKNKTSVDKTLEAAAPEVTGDASFPIVGIGASAGGLAAFEAFFSGMPADTDPGMAFVLVQHLAPDHESMLADIIRHYTPMQVFEVEDGMLVKPNCVYIITPNHHMELVKGKLKLLEPSEPRGQRLPIDIFFRSLAHDQHERSIAIVLSGTGSDGTAGVQAIKGEAGMVMAQTPESSEFPGMPECAIATGMVDYQLSPAEMPQKLINYVAHSSGKLVNSLSNLDAQDKKALDKIFILLHSQTTHDFSQYKPSTIHRRIERRMAVHQIETLESYVKYLQQSPEEVEALFRDLLIGVTNFFRDPEAFKLFEEKIIPQLFDKKKAGSPVRIWVTGCSTGEEAYSIAILLYEYMEAIKTSYTVQIFATDIDSRAIAKARAGHYPENIAADITPQRLARFFAAEPNSQGYRVHKSIRDMLIFSEHNLIKDPAFSRMDLISCRNLLIYLDADLQKKLIPLFHYALNPGGMLFLGTSESVGEFVNLFSVLDRKAKLYQRQDSFNDMQSMVVSQFKPPIMANARLQSHSNNVAAMTVKQSMRELTEQELLKEIAPAAALVNARGDILYLHGRTGMYLELGSGETSINNILKMAREGLRSSLSMAFKKAKSSNESVHVLAAHVKTNDHYLSVDHTISPVTTGHPARQDAPLYLIILQESQSVAVVSAMPVIDFNADGGAEAEELIAALKQELRNKDEYLQSTHEELESSNEELKSSNEEMQSVNEELQSTNEELETSKEELQSLNEELATVNAELNIKVEDLSRLNNDMNNLLAGTGIATVFVDQAMQIMRFTPTAAQIINLIVSDIGRPVGHITQNIVNYDQLVSDIQLVLDDLMPKQLEVETREGKWFMMRILPYRTQENVVEGAVITFVDITEIVKAREELRKANEMSRLAMVVRDANDAIVVQDLAGKIIAWSPGAERRYGWSEAEALQMNISERIPQSLQKGALDKVHELSQADILMPYPTQRITKDGSVVDVLMTATALLDDAGKMYGIATIERTGKVQIQPSGSVKDE